MIDRILLVGAGRTSGQIVDRLARIAPLTLIDIAPAALDAVSMRALPGGDGSDHPVLRRVADGTSRLVLSDLRGDPKRVVGIVIAPGDDRAALESCRLAAELEYGPIIVIVNDRAVAEECERLGARALVRAEIVGQLVEQSLQQGGLGFSSAVGFGRGEVLEFRVLPSSPAIGVPLTKLRADGWRVAAIYRGDALVLPTGSTTIAADDRVLVVGDAKQLPHVAESLRVGLPTFPLLHGPNVVVYLPAGPDPSIEKEAAVLAMRTRASRLIHAVRGGSDAKRILETPRPDGTTARKHFEVVGLDGQSLSEHVAALRAKSPGVVVAQAQRRGLVDVLLGRGGGDAVLCGELGVPVLFPRGSPHYARVVLCLADGESDLGVAEIALDLARMFAIPLRVQHVRLPGYLASPDAATDRHVETIAQRARLHGIEPDVRHAEGNPIADWLQTIEPTDLAVVRRAPTLRDSFSRPDLALRVAREARGSVLVVTDVP